MNKSKRTTLKQLGSGLAALPLYAGVGALLGACSHKSDDTSLEHGGHSDSLFFKISLAQWSLNRSFFGKSRDLGWENFRQKLKTDPDSLLMGQLDPLDFPTIAKQSYNIDAIELVNTFYFSRAQDSQYMSKFKQKCLDEQVSVEVIMCDAEGNLGDLDAQKRQQAVENHYKWIELASFLNCPSIRVNAAGTGTAEEVKQAAIDGLSKLSEFGAKNNVNVLVENHGGYSSNGKWLADLIGQVNSSFCGTLPDFGNFCIERQNDQCINEYDRYQGIRELMPLAKNVSAKSKDFDQQGNEKYTDFQQALSIVKSAGYKGYIGIEYEGSQLSEDQGIRATKALLEKAARQP